MTDEQSRLQPLRTSSELEAEQRESDFLKADEWFGTVINDEEWLDFQEPYTRPNFLLSFRGRPFARMGNIVIISGQAGNGKSLLVSQLITSILHGEFGGLRYELSDTIPRPVVLLIDTEQSKDDVICSKNRVMELCGWGVQDEQPAFRVLMLRNTETAIMRWKKTLQAIFQVKPNVIVLDGIIDIVNDFNDQKECADIIYKCMMVASRYEAAMLAVLHQNPFSSKLTGHLGSAAMRKVTDILVVTKDKDKTSNEVIFNVTETKARGHQDLEDWKFRVLPTSWGLPQQIDESTDFDNIDQIRQWLQDGQNLIEWPATVTDIKRIFQKYGVGSSTRQQRDVEAARNRRFIVEQPREEWAPNQKHAKFNLNIDLL